MAGFRGVFRIRRLSESVSSVMDRAGSDEESSMQDKTGDDEDFSVRSKIRDDEDSVLDVTGDNEDYELSEINNNEDRRKVHGWPGWKALPQFPS